MFPHPFIVCINSRTGDRPRARNRREIRHFFRVFRKKERTDFGVPDFRIAPAEREMRSLLKLAKYHGIV